MLVLMMMMRVKMLKLGVHHVSACADDEGGE